MLMQSSLVDTHCHLDLPQFDTDRDDVIADARERGVTKILVPAIQATGWAGLLQLCEKTAGLYPALGLHPLFADCHSMGHLEDLQRLLAEKRPIAVGEIGLDFFIRNTDRARQQALFEDQLAIAAAAGLPVLIHARKSHDHVLSALRRIPVVGGIAHAFNGSLQQAQRYLDRGFKLGFGGMLTFDRSTKLRALARALPLDAIVLETDAPDMTVAAHRGKRNSPAYLPDVLMALAQIRGEDPEEIAGQTSATAAQLLGLT